MTFAELEYDSKKRRTRREIFLEKMEGLIPWQQLEDRIEPFYPKAGRGRRPYPLGVMLRVHCVQLFYNVSDPGMEDLLYEVESVRRFAGLRLSGSLPDETTILNFRHLLETQGLGMGLFEEINTHLASLGAQLGDDGRQRGGRDAGVRAAAWLRDGGMGRRGLPGCGQAPGEQGLRRRLAGGDEAGQASPARSGRRRGGGREAQGIGAGEGGASVLVCEAALRVR